MILIGQQNQYSFLRGRHKLILKLYGLGTDPGRWTDTYERSKEQNHQLGLYSDEELQTAEDPVLQRVSEDDDALTEDKLKEEVLSFPTNCHECNAPAETKMKMTNIPYFKEVVIMATVCDLCGAKTNEVKAGGGIEAEGKKITLKVDACTKFVLLFIKKPA